MKTVRFLFAQLVCFVLSASGALSSQEAAAPSHALSGVWENSGRFVEIQEPDKLRIVLKPYYGFVYEDFGWIPCGIEPYYPPDPSETQDSGDNSGPPAAASARIFRLGLQRKGARGGDSIPVAVLGNGLYLDFFRPLPVEISPPLETPETGGNPFAGLEGYWIQQGNASSIRLHPEEPKDDFVCYLFLSDRYWRIRYWKTDARYRDRRAEFPALSGYTARVPKFLKAGETLYTCVTGTGTVLRNYETGRIQLDSGADASGESSATGGPAAAGDAAQFAVRFIPDAVVYEGTADFAAKPVKIVLSPDESFFALGDPWLVRADIADLDAEITAHNGKRRPPRKPVFDYMDLVFEWDEIERIRNNGRVP